MAAEKLQVLIQDLHNIENHAKALLAQVQLKGPEVDDSLFEAVRDIRDDFVSL